MSNWDERYRAGEQIDRAPDPLLDRALEGVAPGRALDLACGAGRHALLLAARGWRVTAVDRSRTAIGILTGRAGGTVDARVADLERAGFEIQPNAWDLICDFLYLQRDLFPAIRAGLRPGGLFVAAIPTIDPRPSVKPMNPAYLIGPGELRALFADWEILHASEGVRETRARAVSELIARRPLGQESGPLDVEEESSFQGQVREGDSARYRPITIRRNPAFDKLERIRASRNASSTSRFFHTLCRLDRGGTILK